MYYVLLAENNRYLVNERGHIDHEETKIGGDDDAFSESSVDERIRSSAMYSVLLDERKHSLTGEATTGNYSEAELASMPT